MPITLSTFIQENHGTASADSIIEKLGIFSPNAQETYTSDFYFAKYRAMIESETYDLHHNKMMLCCLEAIILTKAPFFYSHTQPVTFFGQSLLPAEIAVFLKAFIFDISNYGNCAHRAGYAAIQLFNIFKSTDVKILVQSAKLADQFVVYLGNKTMGWYVYDPLTNPELVFTHDEYIQSILPMFPKDTDSLRKRIPVSFKITEESCLKYQKMSETLVTQLHAELDRFDSRALLSTPAMIFSLLKIGIPVAEHHTKFERVLKEIREFNSFNLDQDISLAALKIE